MTMPAAAFRNDDGVTLLIDGEDDPPPLGGDPAPLGEESLIRPQAATIRAAALTATFCMNTRRAESMGTSGVSLRKGSSDIMPPLNKTQCYRRLYIVSFICKTPGPDEHPGPCHSVSLCPTSLE